MLDVMFVKTHEKAKVPTYAIEGAGCFDFYSIEGGIVKYQEPVIFDTGIAVHVPDDYVMLVFSRSGHGFKHDIRLSNCCAVIDNGFHDSIKIKLTADTPDTMLEIESSTRIAQGMILSYPKVLFNEVQQLPNSIRGLNGFGSTGMK